MAVTKYISVGIGALLIIVGGIQTNAQLFGAKWSGTVIVIAGIAFPALVYIQSRLDPPAPTPAAK